MSPRARWLAAGAVALLAALPAALNPYMVTVLIFVFFYAYLGQAWNLIGGYGGQLSAGHAAFVGLGAYTTTLLAMHLALSPWLGMLAGAAVAALLGGLIGVLGFRFGLRGFYFVLLTVAFAEVCRVVALNTELTGGALGLYITFTGDPWQLQFRDNRAYYYLALALMLLATGVVAVVERSRFGAYLAAIREDEDAAEALGVNTFRCKLAAMVLSAFLTGLGGAFYANYLFSLQPSTVFGIPLSVDIIIRPVVGGAGTLLGPILGAFILAPLAEVSRIYLGQTGFFGAHLVAYGLLLVAVVLFLPRGAYPALRRAFGRAGTSGPPLSPVGGGGGPKAEGRPSVG
jgi:branched-chain amino acid transport system permease protein